MGIAKYLELHTDLQGVDKHFNFVCDNFGYEQPNLNRHIIDNRAGKCNPGKTKI